MDGQSQSLQAALEKLRRTVSEAANLMGLLDESTWDGYQTTRQVLSHLVFWHREYVEIATSAAEQTKPRLRADAYSALNALANIEFSGQSMPELAKRLVTLERKLERAVLCLPDPSARLAFKQGSHALVPGEWLARIEAHIRAHTLRQKRASRQYARRSAGINSSPRRARSGKTERTT